MPLSEGLVQARATWHKDLGSIKENCHLQGCSKRIPKARSSIQGLCSCWVTAFMVCALGVPVPCPNSPVTYLVIIFCKENQVCVRICAWFAHIKNTYLFWGSKSDM